MLIMENSEEVMQILERFTKLKPKDIPKELEDYLCYVAKTGDTVYRWSNVKYLFREKLVHVIKDFHDTTSSVDDLPQYPNVDPFNYETMKSALLERLDLFNAAPFTIQRLCELLTDPRKQYCRIDKYMRALEKNILVVSTIEPGRKQADSENGDSLDSVVNGDISLDVNVDIDMENESIFNIETQNRSSTSKTDDDQTCESAPKKAKLDLEELTNPKTKLENEESGSDTDSQEDKENVKIEEDEPKIQKSTKKEEEIKSESKDKILTEKPDKCDDKEKVQNESSCDTSNIDSSKPLTETTFIAINDKASGDEKAISNDELETPKKTTDEKIVNELKSEELESIKSCENTDVKEEPSEVSKDEKFEETQVKEKEENIGTNPECSVIDTKIEEISEKLETENSQDPLEELPKSPLVKEEQQSETNTTVEHKIPEQMSIEDSTIISGDGDTQIPESSTLSILPITEQTPANIINQPQILPDQPMDENLDTVTPAPVESTCLNEVVMQTESDMATDPDPMKIIEEKVDPAGMDVDDTSQEEAMDQ